MVTRFPLHPGPVCCAYLSLGLPKRPLKGSPDPSVPRGCRAVHVHTHTRVSTGTGMGFAALLSSAELGLLVFIHSFTTTACEFLSLQGSLTEVTGQGCLLEPVGAHYGGGQSELSTPRCCQIFLCQLFGFIINVCHFCQHCLQPLLAKIQPRLHFSVTSMIPCSAPRT